MKRRLRKAIPLLAACALAVGASRSASAATIGVDIFSGPNFTGFVGQDIVQDIHFTNWTPFGLTDFSAEIFGYIRATDNGNYQFALTANDDAQMYLDGNLLLDGGGIGPQTVSTLPNGVEMSSNSPLDHPFQIFYSTAGNSPNVLSLDLNYTPNGDGSACYGEYCTYYGDAPVPEPASLLLLGPPALGLLARRRKVSAA